MSYETRYAAAMQARLDRLADTPEAIAWRFRDNAIREQVEREMNERFFPLPEVVTAKYMREVFRWQEARIKELHAEAQQ